MNQLKRLMPRQSFKVKGEQQKTREEAWDLLCRWTKGPNLRKHALAVEAAMVHYAMKWHEDNKLWAIVGLLHDVDYEKYPSLKDHPYKGQEILKREGYSDTIRRGIMAHAPHTGTTRDTLMEKTVFAVDELTGLIVAVALVKPGKILAEVDTGSVLKKMKQRSFAAGVNRDDIKLGASELNMPLAEHISQVLKAMQKISDKLGL